jgi:inhibitor of cysteine peptidase
MEYSSLPVIINPAKTANRPALKGILLMQYRIGVFMTSSGRFPSHALVAIAVFALSVVLVLASGCTQSAPATVTPAATTAFTPDAAAATPALAPAAGEGKKMVTFTEKDNGTTAEVAANQKFAVTLDENPTTGYLWNASTSSGLTVLSSDYQENTHAEGMVGVGGARTWVLQATGDGTQSFTAAYGRSWEPAGNESGYSLTVNIVHI